MTPELRMMRVMMRVIRRMMMRVIRMMMSVLRMMRVIRMMRMKLMMRVMLQGSHLYRRSTRLRPLEGSCSSFLLPAVPSGRLTAPATQICKYEVQWGAVIGQARDPHT